MENARSSNRMNSISGPDLNCTLVLFRCTSSRVPQNTVPFNYTFFHHRFPIALQNRNRRPDPPSLLIKSRNSPQTLSHQSHHEFTRITTPLLRRRPAVYDQPPSFLSFRQQHDLVQQQILPQQNPNSPNRSSLLSDSST